MTMRSCFGDENCSRICNPFIEINGCSCITQSDLLDTPSSIALAIVDSSGRFKYLNRFAQEVFVGSGGGKNIFGNICDKHKRGFRSCLCGVISNQYDLVQINVECFSNRMGEIILQTHIEKHSDDIVIIYAFDITEKEFELKIERMCLDIALEFISLGFDDALSKSIILMTNSSEADSGFIFGNLQDKRVLSEWSKKDDTWKCTSLKKEGMCEFEKSKDGFDPNGIRLIPGVGEKVEECEGALLTMLNSKSFIFTRINNMVMGLSSKHQMDLWGIEQMKILHKAAEVIRKTLPGEGYGKQVIQTNC